MFFFLSYTPESEITQAATRTRHSSRGGHTGCNRCPRPEPAMDAPQEAADEACGRTVALTLVNVDRPSFGFTLSRSKVEPYPKVRALIVSGSERLLAHILTRKCAQNSNVRPWHLWPFTHWVVVSHPSFSLLLIIVYVRLLRVCTKKLRKDTIIYLLIEWRMQFWSFYFLIHEGFFI